LNSTTQVEKPTPKERRTYPFREWVLLSFGTLTLLPLSSWFLGERIGNVPIIVDSFLDLHAAWRSSLSFMEGPLR